MSDIYFGTEETIDCPSCAQSAEFNGKRYKPKLELVEANFSGCGVDVAQCRECGNGYVVSYKIAEVRRDEGFDGPSRQEAKEQERESKLNEAARIEARAKKLREEVSR